MDNIINFELIENYIKEYNLTVKKFCELSKISVTLYYKLKNNKNTLITAYYKIARTMNIPIHILFKQKTH